MNQDKKELFKTRVEIMVMKSHKTEKRKIRIRESCDKTFPYGVPQLQERIVSEATHSIVTLVSPSRTCVDKDKNDFII